MPSGQERSSMQRCYNSAVRMPKEPWLCCYGAPGCTAAPLSQESSTVHQKQDTATGNAPRTVKSSELSCKSMRLSLSEDASMQDLYLLLRGLCDGGWHVSVSVQATPSKESAPSLFDTLELSGCLTEECPRLESLMRLVAPLTSSKSTTPSSKQRDLSPELSAFIVRQKKKAEKKGCLGKLQEGRQ